MEILYPQLPEKGHIYEYLIKNRNGYTHVSFSECEYQIVRTLPEFFPAIGDESDGKIAGLNIIVE